MNITVAILGMGSMGAAVARRLAEHGATVTTVLGGRSAESVQRARDAGMRDVTPEQIAEADIILSIVPPGVAVSVAESLSVCLRATARKPVYVDCNAVAPETAARIGAIIAATGTPFADAGIIGGPPQAGSKGPTFYLSGAHAADAARLNGFGLTMKILDGAPNAASALKMSYAGITKGLTALASVMMLAATRAGMADALHAELNDSQPALLAWFARQVPSMFPKAYRWVAEMEEIAAFAGDDPAARMLFDATADFYRRMAADFTRAKTETDALAAFFR